mgnify:CR=1 FL=1
MPINKQNNKRQFHSSCQVSTPVKETIFYTICKKMLVKGGSKSVVQKFVINNINVSTAAKTSFSVLGSAALFINVEAALRTTQSLSVADRLILMGFDKMSLIGESARYFDNTIIYSS